MRAGRGMVTTTPTLGKYRGRDSNSVGKTSRSHILKDSGRNAEEEVGSPSSGGEISDGQYEADLESGRSSLQCWGGMRLPAVSLGW